MSDEPFSALYEAGFAYGASDIKMDTMIFQFKSEKFELPTSVVHPYAAYNGYFYEIPIDKLRELEREQTQK